jgi:predicted nucleic acid-binding protein
MIVVFADTFYWIAFTNIQDLAHERVKAFTRSAKPDVICTTEEVLTEEPLAKFPTPRTSC